MSKNREKYISWAGAILGALAFFLIYGAKILQPTFIEWSMHDDAAQHFLGWHFFRSEPWSFPLGTIKSLQYPHGTSLVYTDSIPLLAIPLKFFSSLLPNPFQYHGLWLLVCYLLQGFFASRLLGLVTKNPFLNLLGTSFFLMSPVIVQRAGGHEALAGHWLILAVLYLYFQANTRKNGIKWILVLLAATLVHCYLLVMAAVIWSGYLLKQLVEGKRKNVLPVMATAVISLIPPFLAMWAVGYFVMNVAEVTGKGFGYFSMNLLAPVNPAPYHLTFVNNKPLATNGQGEGFNYLGFGLLLLIVISLYELLRHKRICAARRDLPLALAAAVLTVLAISNKITLSDLTLFEIDLPRFLDRAFNIIQSSGRMFWPVSYILMLAAIAVIVKYNSLKRAGLLLLFCIAVQVIDFFPWYRNINLDKEILPNPLQSDSWRRIAEKINHIIFVPADTHGDEYVWFAYLAADHKKTFNVAYAARSPSRKDYKAQLAAKFKKGKSQSDALYVIFNNYYYKPAASADFTYGVLDGYPIIAPKLDLPELVPWPLSFVADDSAYSLPQVLASFSKSGHAVIMSMGDASACKIPRDIAMAMKEKRGRVEELRPGGAYASIMLNGELVAEKIDNDNQVEIKYELADYKIKVASTAHVEINDIPIALNRQAFNIIVLTVDNKEVRCFSYETDSNGDFALTNK